MPADQSGKLPLGQRVRASGGVQQHIAEQRTATLVREPVQDRLEPVGPGESLLHRGEQNCGRSVRLPGGGGGVEYRSLDRGPRRISSRHQVLPWQSRRAPDQDSARVHRVMMRVDQDMDARVVVPLQATKCGRGLACQHRFRTAVEHRRPPLLFRGQWPRLSDQDPGMTALPTTRAQVPVDGVPAEVAHRLANGEHPTLPEQQSRQLVVRLH